MGGHQAGDLASRLVVDSQLALPATGDYVERLAQLRQCLHWLKILRC
jgi:serine/threonine protein phosphatase PrpC